MKMLQVPHRMYSESSRSGLPRCMPMASQILSDILGRKIQTIADPQNVGALGAAMLAAQGFGIYKSVEEATAAIPLGALYEPNAANKAVYDRTYAVYTKLYDSNKKHFATLNGL